VKRVDVVAAWSERLIGRRAAAFDDLNGLPPEGLVDAARRPILLSSSPEHRHASPTTTYR
jgi:hypothetical protein